MSSIIACKFLLFFFLFCFLQSKLIALVLIIKVFLSLFHSIAILWSNPHTPKYLQGVKLIELL